MTDARSLRVRDLSKAFGAVPVLEDISLDVEPGETVALLGPSGCGKTTLLRTMAGLDRPDAGSVTIGDETMSDAHTWVKPERRHVGMVFQEWALFPHLTVGRNVSYGLPRAERRAGRIDEILELVDLGGFADRAPHTLSGGQQQRVALARALAPKPTVLLLDEPFSNLDSTLRIEVRTEVHRLLVELGITTVFVTHDQEEAFVLGQRVAVLTAGRIQQIDQPSALYTRPANRWVAEFIGNVNLIASTATGKLAETPFGPVPLHTAHQGVVDVLIRPEDVEVTSGNDGVVELTEYYGHDAMLFVRLPNGATMHVRIAPDRSYQRDEAIGLRYRGEPTSAFPPPTP